MLRATKNLKVIIVALALVGSSLNVLPAFADDGQPPPQSPEQPVVIEEAVSTTTLQGPSKPNKLGGITPNSYVGGPGGQYGVLTSTLSYYWDFWSGGWAFGGSAKIEIYGSPPPSAKAWTTLRNNGVTVESTGGSPCWAVSGGSCTSSTGWYIISSGHTGSNQAETVVFWSGGGSSYADATASHTF